MTNTEFFKSAGDSTKHVGAPQRRKQCIKSGVLQHVVFCTCDDTCRVLIQLARTIVQRRHRPHERVNCSYQNQCAQPGAKSQVCARARIQVHAYVLAIRSGVSCVKAGPNFFSSSASTKKCEGEVHRGCSLRFFLSDDTELH